MPVKIFFCYAHEDEALLNQLKMHLRPLQRDGYIETWHDRDINAGAEWEEVIKTRLNEAQMILLLISPDFMNSDYCYGVEMQRALERHNKDEACVIPIIMRPVYWQIASLQKLQALPRDAQPVIDRYWHSSDEAFLNITEGIRKIAYELSENLLIRRIIGEKNINRSYEFTRRAKNIFLLARDEAIRLKHTFIGTEHLLLGLVRQTDSTAIKVLNNLGVYRDDVTSTVHFAIYNKATVKHDEIKLTLRSTMIIELASQEAKKLHDSSIGTEHLLLGMLIEKEGIAARVLESLGVDIEKARRATIAVQKKDNRKPYPYL